MMYHPCHGVIDIAVVLGSIYEASTHKMSKTTLRIVLVGVPLILIALLCWLLDMFMCDQFQSYYLHAWGWHLFAAGAIACLHLVLALLLAKRGGCEKIEI